MVFFFLFSYVFSICNLWEVFRKKNVCNIIYTPPRPSENHYGNRTLLHLMMSTVCLFDSARLRSSQPSHDIQTGRGRSSQSPAEGVRRTPRSETRTVRQTVDRRQTTSLDGPSQFHYGHCTLHRTTKRCESLSY